MKKVFGSVPIYFLVYVTLVAVVLIVSGVGIYPDRLVILAAIPVALLGRLNSFLKAWTPFLLFLFAYEFLRGVIGSSDPRVNYSTMPDIDLTVWGVLPTVWLQQHLFTPLQIHWYDWALTGVYLMHFVAPVLFGLMLWLKSKDYFSHFASAFILLSYGALITYLFFPAAPPWLASEQGLIPHVTKILDEMLKLLPQASGISFPSVYYSFDANIVAAVPSLHAAYPTLILLYAKKFFGWKGLVVAPYTFAVWLMVIYFGEHYFSDVVLGIIYAVATYLAIEFLLPRLNLKLAAESVLSRLSARGITI